MRTPGYFAGPSAYLCPAGACRRADIRRAAAQALPRVGFFGLGAPAPPHRLPAMHFPADCVRTGGLISCVTDRVAQLRRAANFIARTLQGVKPAELPVAQPVRFDLAINRAKAKAMGVTIPSSQRLRADEVSQ
jgi:hypothetical protein